MRNKLGGGNGPVAPLGAYDLVTNIHAVLAPSCDVAELVVFVGLFAFFLRSLSQFTACESNAFLCPQTGWVKSGKGYMCEETVVLLQIHTGTREEGARVERTV